MTTTETNQATAPRGSRRRVVLAVLSGLAQLVVVVGLLGGGVFAAIWFNDTEPARRSDEGPREEVARPVVVDVARRETAPVRVAAMGTVVPAREATLRPRVSGMIVDQHEEFAPGGFFEAGSFLLQIERIDYEQTLLQRESELARAEAALQIELGDQAVAREELELLEVDIPEINRDLILRIPQVNQAKAEVRSAEAAVQRAQLELERTRIVAPFDGQVVRRSAAVGNNVGPGDALEAFVGAETYWIELSVPVASLRWIGVRSPTGAPGSRATVRFPAGWGPDATREGEVIQRIGRLEDGSRLARVLVSVPDPLDLQREPPGMAPLLLGAYVTVEIEGRRLDDVMVIDRDLVREGGGGDVVWVMGADDRLDIRPVEIAHRGRDIAYVTAGLDDGDRLVRTNLTTPVEGMLLRESRTPATIEASAGAVGSASGG